MAKKPRHYDYDLIVLGSGAAGGVASHIAANEGKKVAIIEDGRIGGECPNWGCIPSKALITAAVTYKSAKNASQFGIRASTVSVNPAGLKKWRDTTVKRTGTQMGEGAYTSEGIAVIKGHGHFLTPHEVSVGKKRFTARKFLIATGGHNFIPPIDDLEESGYITHREAGAMKTLPKSVFIIGGGAVGTEFAHIFTSFGSKVYQSEFGSRLLPSEDKEVGQLTQALLERDGAKVLTHSEVYKVHVEGSKKVVHYHQRGKTHSVRVDEVMLAAGMSPNTDLGLENAGVKYNAGGIEVKDTMQTTVKHIYAAGDVVGPYNFTHMSMYQAKIAAHNMFHNQKVKANYHAVPRSVFTNPEVAAVGMTEAEALKKKIAIRKNAVPVSILGRANTSNQTAGFVKVITSPTGVLIGASIVAPRAGEMIHELALAVHMGLKAEDVAATIHAFPTWSEAVRVACAGLE